MPRLRAVTMGMLVSLLVTGCADKPARKPPPAPAAAAAPLRTTDRAGPGEANRTGIAACDDYLASYRACHRAAGIFTPDQVEPRYREMRQALLRAAEDPETRQQLPARCDSLARSLRQALHGKSCSAPPATRSVGAGP
jgi:hypothetical protein